MNELGEIRQRLQELGQKFQSIEDKFDNDILHLKLTVEGLVKDMSWVIRLGVAIVLGLLALIIQRALT